MRQTLASVDPRLATIILAAGGSRRLGQPKQLLRFRGTPLIVRTARLARQTVKGEIIVVLGEQQQRLRSLLHRHDQKLVIANNPHWKQGLATSLQAGLQQVPPVASAVLILLVDQAKLSTADVVRLIACWQKRPGKPAAAFFLGRAGAPAVIPRRWFSDIRALEGDIGARQLLRRLGAISLVGLPAAEFDVDTPADATALRP